MLREQSLPAPALGFSICIVLLLATPSSGQSCRGATRLQRLEQAQQELAADEDESDEAPSPAVPIRDAEEEDSASRIEAELPAELEELLTRWEQKCSEIQSLRGTFMRYVYDGVHNTETRANGDFWYKAPNQARMDIRAITPPDPPINPNKLGPDGEPFAVESAENLKWIYTGQETFLIHLDDETFQLIKITRALQRGGIVVKPFPIPLGMPFPDEMTADDVKEQYHLSLGGQHWPEGRVVDRNGEQFRLRPRLHVVAQSKEDPLIRWEILLDGESFLPHAIRTYDVGMTVETVYVFDLSSMRVNEREFSPSPFDERPPRDYTRIPAP